MSTPIATISVTTQQGPCQITIGVTALGDWACWCEGGFLPDGEDTHVAPDRQAAFLQAAAYAEACLADD